jgi:hypothetical protein
MAQTVAVGIATFLLLALLYAAMMAYVFLHQRRPPQYP